MILYLLSAYLFLDLVRPGFAWHFPKVISATLFVSWMIQREKRLSRQNILMLLFLVVMVIDIPIAKNSYEAVWTSYGMAVLFLGLCLPLVQFVDSLSRFQTIMHAWMAICIVIGTWACFHQGFGPGGTDAAQDENYVSACMAMAFPLFVYSALSAQTKLKKILFLAPIPILLLAVVVATDPSRGAFIGFICTIGYMIYHSRKRAMAIVGVGVIGAIVGLLAGPAYWSEIGTTSDTSTGTADHRTDLWRIAVSMFMSYPLTGVGASNFRWVIGDFETGEIIEKYGHSLAGTAVAHSLYFELLAELGVAGVIIFGLIVLRNFQDLVETKRHLEEALVMDGSASLSPRSAETLTLLHAYAQGIAASLFAFLVCSAFVSTLYFSYFWLYSALIASFKLITDQELLLQTERVAVVPMRQPESIQRRNRGVH